MIDPVKVGLAVQNGLSIVCATCSKYWRARDRQIPGDACLAAKPCAGPLAGGSFSEYDGPMTEDRFPGWCFACGVNSDYGLRVEGAKRIFGVCSDHLELFYRLRPKHWLQPGVQVFLLKGGREIPIIDVFQRPRKQTIFEAIDEVERYYAQKEGREYP